MMKIQVTATPLLNSGLPLPQYVAAFTANDWQAHDIQRCAGNAVVNAMYKARANGFTVQRFTVAVQVQHD